MGASPLDAPFLPYYRYREGNSRPYLPLVVPSQASLRPARQSFLRRGLDQYQDLISFIITYYVFMCKDCTYVFKANRETGCRKFMQLFVFALGLSVA